jgi:cell division transport system permease protein
MYSENKSTKRRFAGSYFISLMSIMLVLFVLGMYAFVMIYTDRLLNFVKENIGFEIVMKSNAKESSIISLKDELSKKNYVKSAEYISKEDATNRMKEDLGEDFLQWLGEVENPLLPSIDIRFVADYANADSMAMVEKWVADKTIVKEIIYPKTLTNTINDNINKIKIVLFAVSLILLLIAITLISHTIRLSIYSKRFTVRTMLLVGATEGFVMKPFLKTFMTQGLIAAIIALAFITMALYGMNDYLPEMNMSQGNSYIMVVYASVIGLSLILTFFSTVFSMRKYLNADIDKFYV